MNNISNIPDLSQVIESIPNAYGPFSVEFQGQDEINERKAQKIWGEKCHVLTLDLVLKLMCQDKPVVATWGDHLCYNDDYSDKAVVLTTIAFTGIRKELEDHYIEVDVKVIEGYRSNFQKDETFYIHFKESRAMRCGGSDWPVYVFF